MHRRLFNVMAPQVRPGSIQPGRQLGPQQSLKQMRHRSAHSIRARELVSHTQAECKAALSVRDPEPKISLGMQGRPCKLPANGYASRANSLTAPHHPAQGHRARQGHRICSPYVVMYIGPMCKVRGDKTWEANCFPLLASHVLSPLTLSPGQYHHPPVVDELSCDSNAG